MRSLSQSYDGPPRGLDFALASASGLLCFVACSYFDYWWLAWLAFVPLLWVLEHNPSTRRAIALAWWAGLVASFGICCWMMLLLPRFAGLPWPVAVGVHVLFSAYEALVFVVFGLIVRVGRRQLGLPLLALAPAAIVAGEYLVPYLFPYGLEMSQAFATPVIQIADVLGRLGVVALLLIGNVVLYELIRLAATRRAALEATTVGALLVGVVLLAAAFGYASLRRAQLARQLTSIPTLPIGVVQPDVPFDIASEAASPPGEQRIAQLRERLARLRSASRDVAQRGARLIVWSEAAFPFNLPRDLRRDFAADDWRSAGSGFGVPLLIGAFTVQQSPARVFNSALLFLPDGRIAARYDKNVLVPFGEYLPRAVDFAWTRYLMRGMGGALAPGNDQHTIELAAQDGSVALRLGVLICYEDILASLTRRIGAEHPVLLVNLSNDVWFSPSAEQWQHLAQAIFAAVEQRSSLVRAVNPGPSTFIDPLGRVVAQTPRVDVEGRAPMQSALARLPLRPGGDTFYDRAGHWFPDACVLWCTALLLATWRRARARAPSAVPA